MNYEKLAEWCAKHQLTLEQFMVLHLLVAKKPRTIEIYAKALPFKDGKFMTTRDKDDLIERGLLVPTDKGYTIGKKFLEMYIDEFHAGNELWAIYPGFSNTGGGKMYPLASMAKTVFRMCYWEAINGSWEEHQEVMLDVQFAKEQGLINFGIKKFLESEYWTKFRELRLGDDVNLANVPNATTNSDNDY